MIKLSSGVNIAFLNYLYAGEYTQKELRDNLMLGERTVKRQLEKIKLLDMFDLKWYRIEGRTKTYYIQVREKK
jgi:hypothetical protein